MKFDFRKLSNFFNKEDAKKCNKPLIVDYSIDLDTDRISWTVSAKTAEGDWEEIYKTYDDKSLEGIDCFLIGNSIAAAKYSLGIRRDRCGEVAALIRRFMIDGESAAFITEKFQLGKEAIKVDVADTENWPTLTLIQLEVLDYLYPHGTIDALHLELLTSRAEDIRFFSGEGVNGQYIEVHKHGYYPRRLYLH